MEQIQFVLSSEIFLISFMEEQCGFPQNTGGEMEIYSQNVLLDVLKIYIC